MELDATAKILRFCYLGSFQCVFVKLAHTGIIVEDVWPVLLPLCKELDDLKIVEILKKVLADTTLVRKDETLLVYATYLASDVEIKYKLNVRAAFVNLIKTDNDLFLFCKYASRIQNMLKHKGFTQTVRKAILSWYENKTPNELRCYWMMHRGAFGFTHKKLIKLAHVNDTTIGGAGVVKPYFKKCIDLLKESEAGDAISPLVEQLSQSVLDTPQEALNFADADDIAGILKTNLEESNQDYAADITPAVISSMSKLRTTNNKNEALKIIRKLKLRYNQVPGHLLRHSCIMEELLPRMSYLQLLKCWRYMARYNHFDNPRVLKICQAILNDKRLLRKANIHPAAFLLQIHKLGYREDMSKCPPKKLSALRLKYLQQLYTECFGYNESNGLRMSITLNLQSSYKTKLLRNHKKITFYEASLALAFGYFKRESNVGVYYWEQEKNVLGKINWTPQMELNDAVQMCDFIQNDRNTQRLIVPLTYAAKYGLIFDVFVVLVPSAGRGNPKKNSDFLCGFMDKYRLAYNPNAKFVIVNLMRYKKSMEYSTIRNENILEICGIDEHTTHLINNFALNRFS